MASAVVIVAQVGEERENMYFLKQPSNTDGQIKITKLKYDFFPIGKLASQNVCFQGNSEAKKIEKCCNSLFLPPNVKKLLSAGI